MLSADRVREVLNYDHSTGVFVRRIRTAQINQVGKIAGGPHNAGYWNISIDGKRYLAHRLAWLHFYGHWPPQEIDHIDGNRLNNRISNLRLASRSINQQNRRRPARHNKLGILGVYFDRRTSKFIASIRIQGRNHHIGEFQEAEAASEAYIQAKRQLHSGCTL